MQIRQASIEDLTQVQAIGRKSYRQHFADIWSPSALERYLAEQFAEDTVAQSLSSPCHTWWLLEEQGIVQGFAKV
ncbi:hypothetical protein KJY73_09470 [Bowmanella sp. Y26]|uniref:hypothetical protein n=1 Tax=Bowmanella yangjiangensis TaxID=2811230 RepID=UPI001BDD73D3|nr:hypothetical protein [Bowmanella yangjiangensis]MBT1063802.1 hypothetical protein [Bowmanella yangjiangensis]